MSGSEVIKRSLGVDYNMYCAIYKGTMLFIHNSACFTAVEDISSSILGGIISRKDILEEIFPKRNVNEVIVDLSCITNWVEIKRWSEFNIFKRGHDKNLIVIDQNGKYLRAYDVRQEV